MCCEEERELTTLTFVAEKIEELILSHGDAESDDNFISKNEFKQMLTNRQAVSILHKVGVDVVGLVNFTDTILEQGDGDDAHKKKQLTFSEFMDLILDLRGSKTARNRDIVNLQKHIDYKFQRLTRRLMDMDCVARYDRAALSGETTRRGAQVSVWGLKVQASKTQGPGQSHPPGVTTVATVQDIVTGSLRDLQSSHERELAVLHAENLRLLNKLADHGKTA